MTTIKDCVAILESFRADWGFDKFNAAVRVINRRRLQVYADARQARARYKPQEYRRLYHRQHGICPICGLGMIMPNLWPGELHMDHIDPNRMEGFNNRTNRQLTHRKCNASKGGKYLQQQSKENGKPFTQILQAS